MIYDQHVDVSAIHAPAQANIIIRSKSNQNRQSEIDSDSDSSMQPEKSRYNRSYTSGSAQRIDIDKFTSKLQGISRQTSSKKCAKSIRVALESAGAQIKSHPVAASDWGNTLTKIGYRQINPKFDAPKQGDIYIIRRTSKHTYGHIAGFTGTQWVSDFRQKSYDVYKESGLTYQYYRMAF